MERYGALAAVLPAFIPAVLLTSASPGPAMALIVRRGGAVDCR